MYNFIEGLGLFNEIDWDDIVSKLSDKPDQEHNPSKTNWPQWEAMDVDGNEMGAMFRSWKQANFNIPVINWGNYYPGVSFPYELGDIVAKHVGLAGVHRCWISRIDPGYMTPWHFDGDDNISKYLEKGEPVRLTITISKPRPGHVFLVGNEEQCDSLASSPQGFLFKWHYFREWHAGLNASLTPKLQFHLLGYN